MKMLDGVEGWENFVNVTQQVQAIKESFNTLNITH